MTPAQTTQMPVRESATRSADSSHVSCASRCTPPSPPVANRRMPARAATCAVAATVVAPLAPRAAASGRSRALHLATSSRVATASSSASPRPTCTVPSSSAIVAGTAPLVAHRLLDLARDPEVVGARQAVGDDRRLERDHGPPAASAAATSARDRDHVRLRRGLTSSGRSTRV